MMQGRVVTAPTKTRDVAVTQQGEVYVVATAQTDAGDHIPMAVTGEGHLEVAIHSPLLPFGSLHTESLRPIFQSDGVYQVDTAQETATTSGSGTATVSDSSFVVSTGTTVNSQSAIQSRKRLRYRPGQGVVIRFAAMWPSGHIANSYTLAGAGHAEDGVYLGRAHVTGTLTSTEWGILWVNRGVREVQTLTITTASSTAENVTVTLGGVANTIAVTASANIQRTVWELSIGTYSGWKCYASGATVVFVADAVGNKTGTFSITGTTVVGTFAETKAGVASTDTFIPKSTFNGDRLDGSAGDNNPSGLTLDVTKLTPYQINIQYLGAGAVDFYAEVCPSGNNNPVFVRMHSIKIPGTRTNSTFGNPSFPFTMAAYSAGSTTDAQVKCSSFVGSIEGQKYLHGNRFTYRRILTTVGDTNIQALFTFMNARYYSGRSNQAVVNILSLTGAIKHTSPVEFYIIRNGTLAGNPNFTSYASNSVTLQDQSATTVTFSDNNQLVWSGSLGDTGHFQFTFIDDITLQPGEWLTLGARATTGTPAYVVGALNTREDQ